MCYSSRRSLLALAASVLLGGAVAAVCHLPEAETGVAAIVRAIEEGLPHEDVVVGLGGLGDELRLLALLPNKGTDRTGSAQQIPCGVMPGELGDDERLRGALHGVLGAVDVVGDQDVAGGGFQGRGNDEQVRDEVQRPALGVGQAHHGSAGRDVGLHGELGGGLVGDGLLADLVGVREKGLSVVALFREAARQQGEDELVGVSCCGLAEHLDRRVIKADLVVLDRVAVDADGELEVLVLDGVVARGEVLDLAVADPLPHARNVAEPCVGFRVRSGRSNGRDLGVERGHFLKRLVKQGVEADVNPSKGLLIDNHVLFPPCQYELSASASRRRGVAEAHLDGDTFVVDANDETGDRGARRGLRDGLVVLDVARAQDFGGGDLAAGGVLEDEDAASDADDDLAVASLVLHGLLGPARCLEAGRLLAGDRVAGGVNRHDGTLIDGGRALDGEGDVLPAELGRVSHVGQCCHGLIPPSCRISGHLRR